MKRAGTLVFMVTMLAVLAGCVSPDAEVLKMRELRRTNWAFVIIDIQKAYLPFFNQGKVIQAALSLRGKADEAGVPVIYLRQNDSDVRPGTSSWEFHPSISPRDTDIVIDKEYPSGFTGTTLSDVMTEFGIETIAAVGISTGHCYAATVYDAVNRGYNVIVVSDGHSNHYPNARELIDSYNVRFADQEAILVVPSGDIDIPGRR